MADTFKFQNSDPIVRARLNSDERGAVGTWQVETSYDFEFHGGHTTGYPIYVRPEDNTDTSNLPKFDTRNKSAFNYTQLNRLANGNKLLQQLDNRAQAEILRIIANEWATLQTLAERYWRNLSPPPVQQPVIVLVSTSRACKYCSTQIDFPPGFSGKDKDKLCCPSCYMFS